MSIVKGELFNGRYRLISEKGRGAFGEVWLAHDEQIDLDVALKIYIALDDRGIEDFKSEYKTAYTLNHPNLLHAYHFDVVDRRPFLVMPFCPGSAEALIGASDERIIWRFIRDVSSGLGYLHSKNILHRDIKPDNVLADADGNFLITDFGVSTKMKSTLRRNSTRALSGSDISGTIGYMAPELFSKSPEAVKATDIWALGATLFEIISGELPFYGQGGIMLVRGAEIPDLKGSWSDALRSTVAACLAKETWDRPTAAQLEAYAAKCVEGEFEKTPWEETKSNTEGAQSASSGRTVRFSGNESNDTTDLSEQERIEICRTCQNSKHDMKTGLYCGLTGQKPDFDLRCNNLIIDQEKLEKEQKRKEEVQKSIDQIGGWTAFFLWCGIGLGLLISTISTFGTVFSPGVDAITIGFSLIYLALFLLIGIKAIIAFYKKQENAVPLATAYCIMIALDAAFLLVVNLITKDGESWSTVVRNIIWAGIWLSYLYNSEDINDKFPKCTRKWHNLEKVVLVVVATLFVFSICGFVAFGNESNKATQVRTSQKPNTTVTTHSQLSTTTTSKPIEKTPKTKANGMELPTGRKVYNGNVSLDDGKKVGFRFELDFDNKKGKCYYSSKPLNLSIEELLKKDGVINMKIVESNPEMNTTSALGDKITSEYYGVYNADGSISGNMCNWRGKWFKFTLEEEVMDKSANSRQEAPFQGTKGISSQNAVVQTAPSKDTSSPASVDDNASKLKTALQKGDYSTLKRLADSGYSPAYLPLAKYYLKSPSTHSEADKYAKKAKKAGVSGAQSVIDDLRALGYYD